MEELRDAVEPVLLFWGAELLETEPELLWEEPAEPELRETLPELLWEEPTDPELLDTEPELLDALPEFLWGAL